jgi:hypothetical protein
MEDILNLYKKDTFSIEDNLLINNAIELELIYTDEIKDDFMEYMYFRITDEYSNEEIWDYIDENYSNGLTHKENYNNLINYLNN